MQAATETLLASLYDGVMSPQGFQEFIEALRATFQLQAVTLIIQNSVTHEVKGLWSYGISDEWGARYALDYGREDILAQHVMASPIARFYASNLDLNLGEAFQKSRFNQEWLLPQGIAQSAAAIVLQEGNWFTEIFLQRGIGQADFTREELHTLDQLMQHLRRAIQMRQRMASLQQGHEMLAGALDLLAMPTLLFDEHSRVVHLNDKARALIENGSPLQVVDNHLVTRDRESSRKINFEIGKAVGASRGTSGSLNETVSIARPGRHPLMLMIAPMRVKEQNTRMHGAALMFVFDPERTPDLASDQVRALFGLTPTEAHLAVCLCKGQTLDDIANDRGVSPNTVRSQLKSVFSKTGVTRQAELVSLLLASPAYFLGGAAEVLSIVPGL